MSLLNTPLAAFTVSVVSLSVLYESFTAKGVSFTEVTVIFTVAVAVARPLSSIVYSNESGPL